MKKRSLYRLVILALLVTTFTCNLLMLVFLQRFFYGDLQVPEPSRFYRVAGSIAQGRLGYPDYKHIKEQGTAFDALEAAMLQWGIPVYVEDDVRWSRIAWLSGGFYDFIGEPGLIDGRMFGAVDDQEGAAPVVVVTERFWRQIRPDGQFVSGVQLFIKGTAFEIIGVVQSEWPKLDGLRYMEIFAPVHANPEAWQYQTDDYQTYEVLARMDPGRIVEAQSQVDLGMADIKSRVNYVYRADVLSEVEWRKLQQPDMYRLFIALLVVTGMLFVLGVVNQFLMLVTRSVTVANDLKVMMALGASAKDVMKRFASGFIGLLGIALLLVVGASILCLHLYNQAWGESYGMVPVRVLVEPMGLAGLGVMCFLILVLHLSFPMAMYFFQGENLFFRNRSGGSGFSAKNVLSICGVVVQIALVFATVLGGVAFLKNLSSMGQVSASPYEDRILHLELAFAGRENFFSEEVRQRLDALTGGLMDLGGIEAISASGSPLFQNEGYTRVMIEGVVSDYDETPDWICFEFVTPGYFKTVGLELLEGVDVVPEQCLNWPHEQYIINEAYARKHFPNGTALGSMVAPWDGVDYGPVIGVVEDTPISVSGEIRPTIFIPFYQKQQYLHVRFKDPSLLSSMRSQVERKIHEVDPDVVIVRSETKESIFKREMKAPRLGFGVLLVLSMAGLVLSMSGVFGYQTYMIALRLREFAIKHALGLSVHGIYFGEVKRGVVWCVCGLSLGALIFQLAKTGFAARFFEIELPWTWFMAATVGMLLLFLVVVLVASMGATRPRLQVLLRDE